MLEEQRPRRVVPRWRSSWVTAQMPEAWTKPPSGKPDLADELAGHAKEFERVRTVPVAAELMFLASEAGDAEAARRAATLIIEKSGTIGSSQLVRVAKRILDVEVDSEAIDAPARDFVREARKLLAIDYRNPVLLMDIARELTARRQEANALRFVRSAVALAPQSRFVVRAAARYYLHVGEHQRAHDLLRRTPLLTTDPWVQASEIAVATVRGKTSALAKPALKALSSKKHILAEASELATAVATVELLAGSEKKAKQLFQKALANPNDNSLAQVEWAATRLKLVVDEVALRTPLSFEANSNHAYRSLQLDEAIRHAEGWSEDEPFASRPLDALCYLFSIEGRYEEARRVAERAVAVDAGRSFGTILNLVFAQIQSGSIDDAGVELLRMSKLPEAKKHAAHLLANAGALAFATGENTLGKEFYRRAIKAAQASNEAVTEAHARAFFARTAAEVGDADAPAIIEEAAKLVERLPSPGAIHVLRTLVDPSKRKQLEVIAAGRVAKRKWEWDTAKNTLRTFE